VGRTSLGTAMGAGLLAFATALTVAVPNAAAKNGDTHVVGQSLDQTIDCGGATLIVNGSNNNVRAMGSCWAVTVQGADNTVIADNIVNDITVYGNNETVLFHSGDPALIDRGAELGMSNRLNRIPG
jgi:Protein of unknown function (DUF3060)